MKLESWQKLRDIAYSFDEAPRRFGVSYPSIDNTLNNVTFPHVNTLRTGEATRLQQLDLLPGGRWLLGFSPSTIYIWDVVSASVNPTQRVRLFGLSPEMSTGPLVVDTSPQTPALPSNHHVMVTSSCICSGGSQILVAILFWNVVNAQYVTHALFVWPWLNANFSSRSNPPLCTSHIHVVSLRMSTDLPNGLAAHCLYVLNFPEHKTLTALSLDEHHLFFGGMLPQIYVVKLPCPQDPEGIFTKLIAPAKAYRNGVMSMKYSRPFLFLRYSRAIVVLKVPPVTVKPTKTHSGDGQPKFSIRQQQPRERHGHFPTAFQTIPHRKDSTRGISKRIHLADGSLAPIRFLFNKRIMTLTLSPSADATVPNMAIDPDEIEDLELFDVSSKTVGYAEGETKWRPGDGALSLGLCGYTGRSALEVRMDENRETGTGSPIRLVKLVRGWGTNAEDQIIAQTLRKPVEPKDEAAGSLSTAARETLFRNDELDPSRFAYDDTAYHSVAVITKQGRLVIARFD